MSLYAGIGGQGGFRIRRPLCIDEMSPFAGKIHRQRPRQDVLPAVTSGIIARRSLIASARTVPRSHHDPHIRGLWVRRGRLILGADMETRGRAP